MPEKLSASIVGGGRGGHLSAKALQKSGKFELVAMADVKPEARAALENDFPGISVFSSHEEMFRRTPTDVVGVSTWAPSHEDVTMAALELPLKGILVEKPLGETAAAGSRILHAVKARRIPMVVPHNMLTTPAGREVVRLVGHGAIGRLQLVEIQSGKWDIMNAGIHWLNYFVNLTKLEPISYVMTLAEASTRTYRDGLQVETTAVTCVETESHVRAYMLTGDDVRSTLPDGKNGFRILGTDGVIELGAYASVYYLRNSQRPSGERITAESMEVKGHQRHLEHLAEMIASGSHDYSVADSSLAALELCEAAYISSKYRCKVTFPLRSFTPPPEPSWDPGKPYSGTEGGRDGRNV